MVKAATKARNHIECAFDYLMINYEGFQQPRRSVRVYPRATVRRFDLTKTGDSHQAIHCSDGERTADILVVVQEVIQLGPLARVSIGKVVVCGTTICGILQKSS